MAPPPHTWAARLCHVVATKHLCPVYKTHENFGGKPKIKWVTLGLAHKVGEVEGRTRPATPQINAQKAAQLSY